MGLGTLVSKLGKRATGGRKERLSAVGKVAARKVFSFSGIPNMTLGSVFSSAVASAGGSNLVGTASDLWNAFTGGFGGGDEGSTDSTEETKEPEIPSTTETETGIFERMYSKLESIERLLSLQLVNSQTGLQDQAESQNLEVENMLENSARQERVASALEGMETAANDANKDAPPEEEGNGIMGLMSKMFGGLKSMLGGLGGLLGKGLKTFGGPAAGLIGAGLVGWKIGSEIYEKFDVEILDFIETVVGTFTRLKDAVVEKYELVKDKISGAIESVVDFFSNLTLGKIGDAIMAMFQHAINGLHSAIVGVIPDFARPTIEKLAPGLLETPFPDAQSPAAILGLTGNSNMTPKAPQLESGESAITESKAKAEMSVKNSNANNSVGIVNAPSTVNNNSYNVPIPLRDANPGTSAVQQNGWGLRFGY